MTQLCSMNVNLDKMSSVIRIYILTCFIFARGAKVWVPNAKDVRGQGDGLVNCLCCRVCCGPITPLVWPSRRSRKGSRLYPPPLETSGRRSSPGCLGACQTYFQVLHVFGQPSYQLALWPGTWWPQAKCLGLFLCHPASLRSPSPFPFFPSCFFLWLMDAAKNSKCFNYDDCPFESLFLSILEFLYITIFCSHWEVHTSVPCISSISDNDVCDIDACHQNSSGRSHLSSLLNSPPNFSLSPLCLLVPLSTSPKISLTFSQALCS